MLMNRVGVGSCYKNVYNSTHNHSVSILIQTLSLYNTQREAYADIKTSMSFSETNASLATIYTVNY